MALGKPSKKTQKTISEAPSKTKASGSKATTRAAQTTTETPVKDAAAAVTTKSRKKSPAVVNMESTLPDNVAVQPASEPVMTMSASAGATEPAISIGHSIPQANGQTNGSHHDAHHVDAHHANGSHQVDASHHSITERKTVTREEIAHLAYKYWAERGYTHGSAEEDWKRAEAELTNLS